MHHRQVNRDRSTVGWFSNMPRFFDLRSLVTFVTKPGLRLTRLRRMTLLLAVFLLSTIVIFNLTPKLQPFTTITLLRGSESSESQLTFDELVKSQYQRIELKAVQETDTEVSQKSTASVNRSSGKFLDNIFGKFDYQIGPTEPWFLNNGSQLASTFYNQIPASSLAIWPQDSATDRIVNQLMFVPDGYTPYLGFKPANEEQPLKKILLFFGKNGWSDLPMGQTKFLKDNCPVNTCYLTEDRNSADSVDAILFKDRFMVPKHRRPPGQVWIQFLLECPLHTEHFQSVNKGDINWTATYRRDSDIVAPYEKFVSFDPKLVGRVIAKNRKINFASGKTKKVAWFVSNCGARNHRLEYAKELSKYIDVDIFGSCGTHRCPRSKADECFDMLDRHYKFYLAFENSNCRDYITEKFFVNGLGQNRANYNLIPIVMGASPDDYRSVSPPHSFIHVDDFDSPKQLALFLNQIATDDKLYSRYLRWKGTGQFINTYFWCRLCALLHAPPKPAGAYKHFQHWWSPHGVCSDGTRKWPKPNR